MSDTIRATHVSSSEPTKAITVFGAVAAGATALVTALAVIEGVPSWVVAVVGAVAAVSTAVVGYLTKQSVTTQTTPWEDVAVKATPSGKLISGPADDKHPTGATVAVVADTSPPKFRPGDSVYGDPPIDLQVDPLIQPQGTETP